MNKFYDLKKYKELSRQAAAEGCVLIKNDNDTLPIKKDCKVAVFGRIAFDYYKSGLGSGGLVNTKYVVSILDALREQNHITLDTNILDIYKSWLKENPYDRGTGWGSVPWSQREMPLTKDIVNAAKFSDIAIVIIGRTAGEDQDNKAERGSYLLSEEEETMIRLVGDQFKKMAVILNVGNIIDMSWVEKYNPAAVLYVWQGGQEGGNGVVDVLTGKVNPCGKLADTIAFSIDDYPSTRNFGGLKRNIYQEDIYVGYRYFETFARDSVIYPFGFGLSYTTFRTEGRLSRETEAGIIVEAVVSNTGKVSGKQVVQVYVQPPQGKLGKPERVLVGFEKTQNIKPNKSESIHIFIPWSYIASYDDRGISGFINAFVLEEGEYLFYVGNDVRSAKMSFTVARKQTDMIEQLEEACAPVVEFERMKPFMNKSSTSYGAEYENVPTREVSIKNRVEDNRMSNISYTGDKGYKLVDVLDGRITMETFIVQLSDKDLICLFRGEGMCSSKVTPGTAGAFGGVTESLEHFGIPIVCCADGPSGIRMDCGTKAFLLPNGTALSCTFNYRLIKELYSMVGLELKKNKIDILLGPGMNIHRNPLNGRNFEYFSEDPVLTGKLSSAQLDGLNHAGVTGSIKHFCANNQEEGRTTSDSVVSQRALREIYLKGFEIAIKEGKAKVVMTTYGSLNGIWTAGNYDLCTTILRSQWGFTGVVLTDWWAQANFEGEEPDKTNKASMVIAQNDLYMVVTGSEENPERDNVEEMLVKGVVTRGDLLRNGMNILQYIIQSNAMQNSLSGIEQQESAKLNVWDDEDLDVDEIHHYDFKSGNKALSIDSKIYSTKRGETCTFGIGFKEFGSYDMNLTIKSTANELAQLPISIYLNDILLNTITIKGTKGKSIMINQPLGEFKPMTKYIKLFFGADGMDIEKTVFTKIN